MVDVSMFRKFVGSRWLFATPSALTATPRCCPFLLVRKSMKYINLFSPGGLIVEARVLYGVIGRY